MGPGQFIWFFKVSGWLFEVPGWFFMGPGQIYGFSRI